MEGRGLDSRGSGEEGRRWPLLESEAFDRRLSDELRSGRAARLAAVARALERSALVLSGEVGYERLTVEALIQRSGSNRERFYRLYRDKGECYLAGYSTAIDQLAERLLGAGADAPSWPAGFRQALEAATVFLSRERLLAKGLLAEVHVAGDAARARRKEVFERLSRAIDRARREINRPRHSPPPCTADFILSGIEATIVETLRRGDEDFSKLLPGLLHFAVTYYFGYEAAQAEVKRLGTSTRG